jgi:DNA-binding response OmpR family regulator
MISEELETATSFARGTRRMPRRLRVLLAEDDADLRRLVATSMEHWGYDVIEVGDGAEALDVIGEQLASSSQNVPDIAVADIRMPYLSGLHVLTAVRDIEPPIPIILMTAFGDPETHTLARRLGAVEVFDKPFDLEDLRAALAAASPCEPTCSPRAWRTRHCRDTQVLVVDANPTSATALAEILCDDGFAATSVCTHDAAMAAVIARAPDVVVIDIDLEGAAAADLLAALRAGVPGLGVVITTTRQREQSDVALLIEAFGCAYVRKPLDLVLLSASISRLASASRRADRSRIDDHHWSP